LMLMLLAFIVMSVRGARFQATDVRAEGISADAAPPSSAREGRPRQRFIRGDLMAVGIALVLAFPALPFIGSNIIGDANLAIEYALVGISLVLLIGLVGQISLAQASFVGIGAFVTGLIIQHLHVPFPANMPIAAAVAGLFAGLLGVVALRVRGLYLAVATLIFAWMCDAYLFQQSWLVGEGGSTAFAVPHVGVNNGFPSFDFSNRRTFYYIALATLIAATVGVSLIRRSKTGRAFFAVRGSEVAAASLGIDVTRYKLLAFGLSGVVAGVAGNLFAANSGAITTSEFTFTVSLFYLSIAVVGGLTSSGGAIGAGILFAALNEVFFQVDALAGYLDIVSSGLLIVVLLAYPGGLAAIPRTLGRLVERVQPQILALTERIDRPRTAVLRVVGGVAQRVVTARPRGARGLEPDGRATGDIVAVVPMPVTPRQRLQMLLGTRARALATEAPTGSTGHTRPVESVGHDVSELAPRQHGGALQQLISASKLSTNAAIHREDRPVVLGAEHVSMRFGGLLAVDDVSLSVREGEIVGLIGPNGAGKTTTFNCISGLLVPTSGIVSLFDRDVTSLPVHQRAKLGLGRTFQVIQLFPQLTVFDNLLVATHGSNPTGVLSHLAVSRKAIMAEREAREWVMQVVELLDLQDVAERSVAGLPFGVLRMVEVARAVVTGARLVMLDEPASGLDNTETQGLADLLLSLRAGLGLTLLLIEHDVKMVTSVSDYMYVLDRGRLLAEGTPREVQRNREVIAAYLGEPADEVVA
jgi:ABC-type branched-subunit amino acid transport system ATPase component/ABC-type branched-subunit amino acid transport system permease subunit